MKKLSQKFAVIILLFIWIFSGWLQVSIETTHLSIHFPPQVKRAHAAITASSTIYSAGTHNYIVSTNACSQVFDVWGAGGGGSIGNAGGGAGGGGAFASSTQTFAESSSHTLVVASGGAEDTNVVAGANPTTLDTTVMIVDGGTGTNGNNPGLGGTVANTSCDGGDCPVEFAGGEGGDGHTTGDEGGGGGGAGGPTVDGVAGTDAASNVPGGGGAGNGGTGGAGGSAGSPGTAGTANTTFGGGGGGGGGTNSSGGTGGNPGGGGGSSELGTGADQRGGHGQITITEYVDDAGCGGVATITTNAATGVSVMSAILNATISDDGGDPADTVGFAYGADSTLAVTIATTTETGTFATSATFDELVSTLQSGVTYYFRAYAINDTGTGIADNTGGGCTNGICSFTTGTDTSISRRVRLFEGFMIRLFTGKIRLFGQ